MRSVPSLEASISITEPPCDSCCVRSFSDCDTCPVVLYLCPPESVEDWTDLVKNQSRLDFY